MSVWSLAMELLAKYESAEYELIYSGEHDRKFEELEREVKDYQKKLEDAYKEESEKAEKVRNDELDYFCGRHTFYPFEC